MTAITQAVGELPVQAELPRMREQPRFSAVLDLVALPTAVTVTRLFVADTLRRWGAMFIEPDMEEVAAELVCLSVEATGPAEGTSWQDIQRIGAIKVCLVGWSKHIIVEVSDEHDQELALHEDVELADDSGLGLIDTRAGRWVLVYDVTGGATPDPEPANMLDAMRETVRLLGCTILSELPVIFQPHGATLVLVLAESHLVVSTWPEHRLAHIDLFTCRADAAPEHAIGPILTSLGGHVVHGQRIHRTSPRSVLAAH
ncbi:MAG: S-adenosylmethionine decarboxylase family protein [Sciscionella sp.]